MGKDDFQLAKDRFDRLEKLRQDQMINEYQEKKRFEDGQASAFLISSTVDENYQGPAIQDENNDQKRFLLFTVPEHPKPKFLSKTSLLQQLLIKEAEHLGGLQAQQQLEDNSFIFNEIMKNDIIREEFQKIRDLYGEEAFELNKLSLLNFIKKGRQNFTYSVKYYGVDEGQIGILSRKVPFDQIFKQQQQQYKASFHLPKIDNKLQYQTKPKPKKEEDLFEFVEIEQSEDEEYTVEVTDDEDDDDFVPVASKPNHNSLQIVQGTVLGSEFQGLQKDSKPLNQDGEGESQEKVQVEKQKAKKVKKIKQTRRVKRKRIVKKLKQTQLQQDSRLDILGSGLGAVGDSINPIVVTLSDGSGTIDMMDIQSNQHDRLFNKNANLLQKTRSQPDLKINHRKQNSNSRQHQGGREFQYNERMNQNLQEIQNVIDQQTPYMINFRELFKRVELNNLKDFKKPQPEKYDQHIVHSYSLPKGLHALKRQQVLSEAETYDLERYSKRNIQLHMIDKGYQKMNLAGQTYGMKGSKVKPIYFSINNQQGNQPQSSGQTQTIVQSNMKFLDQQISTASIEPLAQTMPIKAMSFNKLITNNSQNISTNNQNQIIRSKILMDETQLLDGQKSSQRSQRDHKMTSHFHPHPLPASKTPLLDTDNKNSEISKDLINISEQSVQNQAYQLYNFSKPHAQDPKNNRFANNESTHIQGKIFQLGIGSLPFDKGGQQQHQQQQIVHNTSSLNNTTSVKPLNQATKKNNQIIKNLARNKKTLDSSSQQNNNNDIEAHFNFDFQYQGIFDQSQQNTLNRPSILNTLTRNASQSTIMGGAPQYGFQISNQMKGLSSYLMDTKKLLQEIKAKKHFIHKGKQSDPNQDEVDDDEDDQLILNQEMMMRKRNTDNIHTAKIGSSKDSHQEKVISLPQIKQSMSNDSFKIGLEEQTPQEQHPNVIGSQYELILKIIIQIKHLYNQEMSLTSKERGRVQFQTSAFEQPKPANYNNSNVKVICRIRPPKIYERRTGKHQQSNQSASKHYTSLRNRSSRSGSKELSSPYTQRNSSIGSAGSSSSSKKRSTRQIRKNQKVSFMNNSGLLSNDTKYCIFTTKERSNVVLASENLIPGKIINENNFMSGGGSGSQTDTFNFDQVFNESFKQDKFYQSAISPAIKSFIEGQKACILLFGPTEGGKTFTLKGKTGVERGILPRAVEDIFNIVRNSESREQEEYEDLNHRMMVYGDEEDYHSQRQDQEQFNGGYKHLRNLNQIENDINNVPERMFLKVQVYQIFVDKVLDLLNSQSVQKIQLNNYLDKETQEVLSKISNISEKAVFSLEDFYSVLQEAFKNRRIESVNMQEQELRKKSHFVISLTLMQRTQTKRIVEVSTLNFIELSGSEQAVAEDQYYQDASIRQFVTRSFNGLSSQILKSALRKKQSTQEEGDIKVVGCLRNTLSQNSNIVLICNINPSQPAFEHSLPAIKFCARIRDYIIKKGSKTSQKFRPPAHAQDHNEMSQSSINEIRYSKDFQNRNSLERQNIYSNQISNQDTTKEIIEFIKEDLAMKQLNSGYDQVDNEGWIFEKIDKIERLKRRLQQNPQNNTQSIIQIQELDFLKDSILKMKYNPDFQSPTNNQYYSQGVQSNRSQPNYNSERNPFSQQTSGLNTQRFNYQQDSNFINSQQKQPYDYRQDQDMILSRHSLNQSQERKLQFDSQQTQKSNRINHIFTDDDNINSQIQNLDNDITINQSQQTQNVGVNHQQRAMLKPNPLTYQQKYQTDYRSNVHQNQNQEDQILYSQLNDQTFSRHDNNEIQPYRKASNTLSQHSRQSTDIIKMHEISNVHSENDYLNKAQPYKDQPLKGKKNSISEHNSPESLKYQQKEIQQVVQATNTTTGFRAGRVPQGLQKGYQVQQLQLSTIKSPTSSQSQSKSQLKTSLSQHFKTNLRKTLQTQAQDQIANRIVKLKQETVYQNQDEAVSDVNRLIKLNDYEGIKLRMIQIYKEKEAQDQIMSEQGQIIRNMNEDISQKEELLQEQDKLIRETHQEYQITIDDLNQQKQHSARSQSSQSNDFIEHFKDFQQKINDLEKEREKLLTTTKQLESENQNLIKAKEQQDQSVQKIQEENSRLKSNYDILKEHEMSIIKDYEGKKNRDLTFYEQKLIDQHKQLQDEKSRSGQIQNQESLKQEMQKQIEQTEREYAKLEAQRDKIESDKEKAMEEIGKLHRLVEEMDKNIQQEQHKQQEELRSKDQKDRDIKDLLHEKAKLEDVINQKEHLLEQGTEREEEYKRQLGQIAQMNEDLQRQLTLIKAKEYDKVDFFKRGAELEARITYLEVDNENLVRERNNLDIANVTLKQEKHQAETQLFGLENELDYFRKLHEEQLDKFDQKFESISIELLKLKNENISLKEKDKSVKRQLRDLEEERDQLSDNLRLSEKKNEEIAYKLQEIEREVRLLMIEREKDIKDSAFRQGFEGKYKEENKGKMLEEIQNMIKQYKVEKGTNKSNGSMNMGNNAMYSTYSSGYN